MNRCAWCGKPETPIYKLECKFIHVGDKVFCAANCKHAFQKKENEK
jgi:hypothetical protein